MDLLHRFFQLHRLLDGRRTALSRREIEQALGCSPSTVKRLVGELRNYGAPIEAVPGQGYRYQPGVPVRLPALGLSPGELSALLLAHGLLRGLGGDTLFAPLQQGVTRVIAAQGVPTDSLHERLRLKPSRHRGEPACLPVVLEALLLRRRLRVAYAGRNGGRNGGRDGGREGGAAPVERDIAPARLTRYRDNWYLEAWCYLRRDLRSFALDRVVSAASVEGVCDEVRLDVLDAWSDAAYGIFNGPVRHVARLRFGPERAPWALRETWHPRQRGVLLADGRYELEFPYADPTELIQDLLRLGPAVEVLGPPALREAVAGALRQAAAMYDTACPAGG